MCLNIHIDFYNKETKIQSVICDLKHEINDSEEIKVDHYKEKSEVLNEQKTELDIEFNLAKCIHRLIFLALIESSFVLLTLFKSKISYF